MPQPPTQPGPSHPRTDTRSDASARGEPQTPQEANPMTGEAKKKKKHRAGKKRRNRRQSFIAAQDLPSANSDLERPDLGNAAGKHSESREHFYRAARGNPSATSLETEALLDHRETGPLNARRQSVQQSMWGKSSQPRKNSNWEHNTSLLSRLHVASAADDDDDDDADDHTPLIRSTLWKGRGQSYGTGQNVAPSPGTRFGLSQRRPSNASSRSGLYKPPNLSRNQSKDYLTANDYDVNNPPSVPGSPTFGPTMGYEDAMLTESRMSRDAVIDIDDEPLVPAETTSYSPTGTPGHLRRRMTITAAEDDVCFPQDVLSEVAEEDEYRPEAGPESPPIRRRRRKQWPDLAILNEWRAEENEERAINEIRARKVNEPLLVGGRLRPQKQAWHREVEDAPYRFTYFNEEFESTVHSQTISELLQPGQTFRDLFIPEPPLLSDDSSEDDDDWQQNSSQGNDPDRKVSSSINPPSSIFKSENGRPSLSKNPSNGNSNLAGSTARSSTPSSQTAQTPKPRRYGARPVFWLDVLSPTDAEMRTLSKAFGIHPLTAEDIMMQEAREKVELFRNYYFVNYRSFEQDANNEDYLEPVNMYVVVFREGVLSFHFSQTPHPANVRRRIRQLTDYLFLTTDWISYAIIDDITDAYAPLIQSIEEEVDGIDQSILEMHTVPDKANRDKDFTNDKASEVVDAYSAQSHGDMLRHVGECRKKVMGLYRLLGTKADVIKGFAKRCNEQWEVAPKSEIGLYLGDIQDHIVTMTGNLSHYENILSRSHYNYLAQINIRMNERAEKTNDVLSKLTVLGTIVLPMNIITGMWGMNVLVPGQDIESLTWFWSITAGLAAFGFICFFIAKRTFGIV